MALARHREVVALAEENENLADQLEVRKLVDRAKGKLMDEFSMSEHSAFRFVQTSAMGSRRSMREVAELVLSGELTPDDGP